MTNHEQVWQEVCLRIKNSGIIKDIQYNTWIDPIERAEFGKSVAFIWTPNSIAKNSIEERYIDIIETAIFKVTKKNYRIVVLLHNQEKPLEEDVLGYEPNKIVKNDDYHLNAKYTFDNFVVGNSNKMAHAYALSVAESPGGRYNPLFLYGKSGLGKTHLCHAIAHFMKQSDEDNKIIYVSAEKYTNDFITALQNKTTDLFREKYRNADILIVDDIQFFSGKESTLEEFFHTFNELYDNSKQIVLTADRPPKEISDIGDRLVSRFSWGLLCDITPPDFEMRIAILKNKAKEEGIEFSDDVYVYIADNIKSNIRELEGALNKIIAFKDINGGNMDEFTIIDILKEHIESDTNISVSYDIVKEACCKYFHITMEELMGKSKRKELVFARQIAMFLSSRVVKKANSSSIGREFDRDHSTVLYALNKIQNDYTNKIEKIVTIVNDIENSLRN